MTLTPELFQKHFEVNDDTLIMSPLAAVCADSLGYNFTYNRQSDDQYQTVIVDEQGTNIRELSHFGDRIVDGGDAVDGDRGRSSIVLLRPPFAIVRRFRLRLLRFVVVVRIAE